MNRLPLPQGQRSSRPSFSSSCLLPWTMRMPRFTWRSDGNPLRRLLIGSNGVIAVKVMEAHGTPPLVKADRREEVSSPGIEPGPQPSQGRVRICTLQGRVKAKGKGQKAKMKCRLNFCLLPSHLSRHEREESNLVRQFWRLLARPGAHSCNCCSCEQRGYPNGVEPLPSGSQPAVQQPLHHGHHVENDQ